VTTSADLITKTMDDLRYARQKRELFTEQTKIAALEALKAGWSIRTVASQAHVAQGTLLRWKKEAGLVYSKGTYEEPSNATD
jgi:hypothetical protein